MANRPKLRRYEGIDWTDAMRFERPEPLLLLSPAERVTTIAVEAAGGTVAEIATRRSKRKCQNGERLWSLRLWPREGEHKLPGSLTGEYKEMKRWHVVAAATLVATTAGSCMSYIAGRENPQGEFSGSAGDLSLWVLFSQVFVWYFVPAFLLALLSGVAIWTSGGFRSASR